MIYPNDLFIANYFQLEIYLSFIILFGFIFVVLNNTKFFNNFISGAISFGVTLLIVAAHYTGISYGCFDFVNIIHDSTSGFALIILVIVVIIILIGVLGLNLNITKYIGYAISLVLVTGMILFFSSTRVTCNVFEINWELLKQPIFIIIILVAGIILWLMSSGKDDADKGKHKDSDIY